MFKLKDLAINIGVMLGTLTIGFGIAEIGVRVANLQGSTKPIDGGHASFIPTFFTIPDPARGWSYRPNAEGLYKDEGEAYLKFNSAGLRGPEVSLKKPADTIRIAVLGDSFTSAVQVEMEKTYAEVMEKELNNQCPYLADKKIEVINFGVNGYGTAQELFTLQQEVWDYDPDVVVLGFYIGNDLMNNSMKLADNLYSPFFVYDKNGNLGIDMSFPAKSLKEANPYFNVKIDLLPGWLINNIRLLQLARQIEVNHEKKRLSDFIFNSEANVYRQPKTPEWQEAWDITEQLLTFFANDVKQQGKDFLLVTIASANQVIPDPNIRKAYMESNQIINLFYPDQRIKALGDRQGFRVFNLGQPFQQYAEANNTCLHGFQGTCGGHWNEQGHKLGGEMIADKLCKKYFKKSSTVNEK
jgi:hypothetical protein